MITSNYFPALHEAKFAVLGCRTTYKLYIPAYIYLNRPNFKAFLFIAVQHFSMTVTIVGHGRADEVYLRVLQIAVVKLYWLKSNLN